MELFGRRIRLTIDLAIRAVVVVVLLVAVYLAYSVWSHNRGVATSTPVARQIAALEELIAEQPGNVVARLQLAQAYTIAGREDAAVAQYAAILAADPENVTALSGLGFISSTKRQWATAEGYWQRIIDILEGRPAASQDRALEVAYFYMGDVKAEQKKWEEAIPYYKAALRIKRDASDTHYHLAVAYRETDSTAKYREELEIALAFDPTMPEANYDLGRLLLESGDEAAAAEHFRISADSAPAAEAPRDALAELGPAADRVARARSMQATDPAGALIQARVAVALEPADVPALVLAAQLYEKAREKERALETWKRVLALAPQNAEARSATDRLEGK